MQAEREAPAAGVQAPLRRQPTASFWALPQETPAARRPSTPPMLSTQTCAEAPAGAVELPPEVPPPGVELLDPEPPPQPASSAAARTAIANGVASLGDTPQTYPQAVSSNGLPGCRCPQTGQPGSGTTGSRLTSIVRRS